jgi:DNA-binding MarR family transcriptional regulator
MSPMTDSVALMVQQWMEALPDLDVAEMATVKRLVRICQELEFRGTRTLEAFQLDQGEFDVLATLLRVGQPHQLTPTALFQSLLVSSSGMTKRVDRLEARSLVRRDDDPDDRRSRLVGLTAKGIKLTTAAVRAHTDACVEAVGLVDARCQGRLSRDLSSLLAALEEQKSHR